MPDGEHHVVVLVDRAALDNLTSAIGSNQAVRTQSIDKPAGRCIHFSADGWQGFTAKKHELFRHLDDHDEVEAY